MRQLLLSCGVCAMLSGECSNLALVPEKERKAGSGISGAERPAILILIKGEEPTTARPPSNAAEENGFLPAQRQKISSHRALQSTKAGSDTERAGYVVAVARQYHVDFGRVLQTRRAFRRRAGCALVAGEQRQLSV